MKGLLVLGVAASCLGFAACAIQVDPPSDGTEPAAQTSSALDTPGTGQPAVPSNAGQGASKLGTRGVRPDGIDGIAYDGTDPSGPNPQPWDCQARGGSMPAQHPWSTSSTGASSNDDDGTGNQGTANTGTSSGNVR